MRAHLIAAGIGMTALVLSTGCDTGFGQPCDLPQTPQIRQACSEGEPTGADGGNEVVSESKPSCALKNYAGCETRICLVYRGSSPFCSERCQTDGDCEGSASCRPILGERDLDPSVCEPAGDGFDPECYCVRSGDVDN